METAKDADNRRRYYRPARVRKMSRLFYNLGRKVGPHVRKAKWMWQSMTGSEADAIRAEHEVGQDLARQIKGQLKPDPEPRTAQMLNEVGFRLAACVANKLRRFSFETVEGGEPNAFALPGGFIFVTRSLVELCEWQEDEVAFILGHEMSHVMRGHAMDRIISNSAIAMGARAAPIRGSLSRWLQKVGVRFLESAYSQDLELEADRLAVRLTEAAGYDPKASIRLLSRLAEISQRSTSSTLGDYFSSHPHSEVRIRDVKNLLRQRGEEL
ncbi:MAG TPA: M48 family metallopeptidase [Sedimentisphaerales bacterium]|nr:M48 family metallopeptidase [Sedimentisphaerales bacterium]